MAEIPLENIVRDTADSWCESNGTALGDYTPVRVQGKGATPALFSPGSESYAERMATNVKRALAREAPEGAVAVVNVMNYSLSGAYGLALVPKDA